MRSPLWFVVAGLIVLASLAGALGRYTIYHEKKSTVDGRYYASETVSGLRLRPSDEATGAPVTLTEPAVASTCAVGNKSGSSIFAFTIDRAGRYRLAADLADARSEPKAVLAIEQGTLGGVVSLVFGTIAIAFAGLAVAGAIVLVVLWRRSKAVEPHRS
jgi:hypothetical protein